MVWLIDGVLKWKPLYNAILVVRLFRIQNGILVQKTVLHHVWVLDVKHHRLQKDVVFSKIFSWTQFINLVYVLVLLILLIILLSWGGLESAIFVQIFWRSRLNFYLSLVHLLDHFISSWDVSITFYYWRKVKLTGLEASLLTGWLLATLDIQGKWILNLFKSLERILSFGCGLVSHIERWLLRDGK